MSAVRLKLLVRNSGNDAGHVGEYPVEVAAVLLKCKHAVETKDKLTPRVEKAWAGGRAGDEYVADLEAVKAESAEKDEQLSAKDAEIEALKKQLAAKNGS